MDASTSANPTSDPKPRSTPKPKPKPESAEDELARISRVKKTMLCMQRASWEQGVAAQAILELGQSDPKHQTQDVLAELYALCHDAVVRQDDDGRLGARLNRGDIAVTSSASIGIALLAAFDYTREKRFIAAARKQISYLLEKAPRNDEGVIYTMMNAPQFWVDSIYMCPPFLASASGHPGIDNLSLREVAINQLHGYINALWDPEARLFSHIYDDKVKRCTRLAFWSVGNGWAVAGIMRVVTVLPEEVEEREGLLGILLQTVEALLTHLRKDGRFHDVVNDDKTFVETNASQMLAYTIARMRKYLLIPEDKQEEWMKAAKRMRTAAQRQVNEWGYVRGVCGSPSFNAPGTAAEGQAWFLLMEAAFRGL